MHMYDMMDVRARAEQLCVMEIQENETMTPEEQDCAAQYYADNVTDAQFDEDSREFNRYQTRQHATRNGIVVIDSMRALKLLRYSYRRSTQDKRLHHQFEQDVYDKMKEILSSMKEKNASPRAA